MIWQVAGVGSVLGLLYAISPLTVVVSAALVAVLLAIRSIEDDTERRLLTAMFVTAIALRVAAIAVLFVWTDHTRIPFGSLFGDEDYFIRRALWLRNLAIGQEISPADMIYAYDRYIHTSYVWVLAGLDVLFGPATYGVRLVSVLLYMAGSLALYRTVRESFGLTASLLGLGVLWFLPSLFSWSISALKDPLFFALVGLSLWLTVSAIRSRARLWQAVAVVGVVATIAAAESVRGGGLALLAAGTAGGVLLAWAWRRPRLAGAALAVTLVAVPVALSRGEVRDAVVVGVHRAAEAHWEHVNTRGNVYTLLDQRHYEKRLIVPALTLEEGIGFVGRAIAAYFVVPLPWQAQSRMALAYAPEQVVWWAVLAFGAVGAWTGMRRDPLLSSLLFAHFVAFVIPVALTSGNIGTLVRHRGLALAFLVWFAGLGVTTSLAWWSRRSTVHLHDASALRVQA